MRSPAQNGALREKSKRVLTEPRINLVETVDILKSVAEKKNGKIFVGFALETDEGSTVNAEKKLSDKSLDMIVLNNPHDHGAAFGTDTNKVTFIFSDGAKKDLPLMPKYEVALRILDEVKRFRHETIQS